MSPVRRGLAVAAVAALALAAVAWLAYGQPVVAGALVVIAAFATFGAISRNGGE